MRVCVCVCVYVSGSRHDAIFGGLITARCVDARRSLVLAGLALITDDVDARQGFVLSSLALVANGGSSCCLVLAGTALVCPTHMWCVYVYVCVWNCVCN